MRTNIDLDDELLARAAEIAGTKTKKSTVEYALRELIRRQAMRELAEMRIDIDPEDVRPGWERSRRKRERSA
jgi:Arc/MetJ family transcription regulator